MLAVFVYFNLEPVLCPTSTGLLLSHTDYLAQAAVVVEHACDIIVETNYPVIFPNIERGYECIPNLAQPALLHTQGSVCRHLLLTVVDPFIHQFLIRPFSLCARQKNGLGVLCVRGSCLE